MIIIFFLNVLMYLMFLDNHKMNDEIKIEVTVRSQMSERSVDKERRS